MEINISIEEITNSVLSKIIESDPDLIGAINNLLNKKLSQLGLRSDVDIDIDDEISRDFIRKMFGFDIDSTVYNLICRVDEIEKKLGIKGYYYGGKTLDERIQDLENEIKTLEATVYGR